jgi:2-keto-4-pentenoate hydratase/2-oxohepta-3-ene-1,7-dioic acid hydratase in catechol pathway
VALPGDEVVFEAELAVVIGKQCRNVDEADVPDVLAGYTVVNDLSDTSHEDRTMFRKKSFDNAAPIGPVVASPEEVDGTPRIRLWVNGEQLQDTAGDSFVFSVPEIVASFAERLTLEPGDVIMMGNPGGFDPLEDGDTVEIEVEGVGRLEHDVSIPE